ncbi:hypothetical protein LCGC14_0982920 [marine sediment metagenome]|uniref:DUF115 domain-containing protein n=1 Tax=marine sediment metagenome TaxID=412755 RepID=A0A0F9NCN7_9ZZZZ
MFLKPKKKIKVMSFKSFNYKTENTVFCIGAGPSARGFNFDILEEKREEKTIIVVNRVMDKIKHADFAITCDTSILKNYFRHVSFSGIKIAAMYEDFGQPNAFQVLTRNESFDPNIHFLARRDNKGLSCDASCIHGMANSGFGALGLAFHMVRESELKRKRIVLIGYDFRNHQDYWYNNTKLGDKDFPHNDRQLNQFMIASHQCGQEGVEVINCSPGSRLPFQISSLSQVRYL